MTTFPSYPGVNEQTPAQDVPSLIRYMANVAQVVGRLLRGKMNVVGEVTLTANAANTTLSDARLAWSSTVHFEPMTANAAAEIGAGTMYVTALNRLNGSWTITHANNAQADRMFRFSILG